MIVLAQAVVLALSAQGAAPMAQFQAPVAQAAPDDAESTALDGFGHDALVQGRTAAAIDEITANTSVDHDDPARLINLSIAHARSGDAQHARSLFEAAVDSPDRADLETADGRWVDSRKLARRALAMLDRGDFATTAIAAR